MTAFGFGTPTISAYIHRQNKPSFNLRPYIKSISLNKDLSEPAGMFELGLAYAPDTKNLGGTFASPESIFQDMLPQDYIEMQVQTEPGSPSYRMRGFFDNVSISEQASQDGSISRQITLNGRDYGSLMQNFKIIFNTTGQDLAKLGTADGLALLLGFKEGNLPPNLGAPGLVERVINTILNEGHINVLRKHYNPNIKLVKPEVTVPRYFGVVTPNVQTFTGSLDDLVRQIQSPPWAEYFIRDEEDGPHFYYRMAPFLDHRGYYAWSDSKVGQGVKFWEIDARSVIENDLTKSQNEVYTYFLSIPTALQDLGQQVLAEGLSGSDAGAGNPWWDGADKAGRARRARQFGYRPLEVQTPWVLGDTSKPTFTPIDEPDGTNGGGSAEWWALLTKLNKWLVDTMGFMEEMRTGTIICRGFPGCRVGDYVYYRRPAESTGSYYYVQGIELTWQEGSPIQTTLQVIRGWPLAKMDTHTRPHPASKPKVRHPIGGGNRGQRAI